MDIRPSSSTEEAKNTDLPKSVDKLADIGEVPSHTNGCSNSNSKVQHSSRGSGTGDSEDRSSTSIARQS